MNNLKDAPENTGSTAATSTGDNKGEMPVFDHDSDWNARIARAKEARIEGKKAREGKPLTFRMTRKLKIK